MRSILITGGSGAFGSAFVRYLLNITSTVPARIAIFSRSEHRQAELRRQLEAENETTFDRCRWFIGDVRDRDRLRRAMEGIEIVIHAAALKRIEVGAYDPLEVKKTNIDGTANVIEAALDARVERAVLLSTDKAYQPISPYGTSKAFAESLWLAANNMRGSRRTAFACVRYGNVWGSTGSVVPTWRKILETSDTVPVTDPDCTRFYMTMQGAIDLVFHTALHAVGGEVEIPVLPAYRLGDLADAMGAKMDIRGLPAYEKLHESMSPSLCSGSVRRMMIEELREALRCST